MEQWLSHLKEKERPKEKKSAAPRAQAKEKKGGAGKLSYKLQRELDGMEERILEAESRLEELNARLAAPEIQSDGAALQSLCLTMEEAGREVEALYARWEELERLREEAQG
jgi:ATP-binding cassette subfamily F protein uup